MSVAAGCGTQEKHLPGSLSWGPGGGSRGAAGEKPERSRKPELSPHLSSQAFPEFP